MRILRDVFGSFWAGCQQAIEDQRRIFRAVSGLFNEKPPRP
jgi:hypothetical protein